MNHTSAARALAGEGGKASDYQEVEIDSGSDDEEGSGQSHPLLEEDLAAKQVSLFLVSCLIHICDGMEIIHVPYWYVHTFEWDLGPLPYVCTSMRLGILLTESYLDMGYDPPRFCISFSHFL